MTTTEMAFIFFTLGVASVLITCVAWFGVEETLSLLSWWCWRRWQIYVPSYPITRESRKSVVARLNRQSWPCSDKPLFWPAMEIPEGRESSQ